MSWGPDLLIYPFLFIAIYFEAFLLVTFLSAPARARRARGSTTRTPKVAIIVPCYNEEHTIAWTVTSLLSLEYPQDKLSIVLVDDGSTDKTPQAMAQFSDNPSIKIIRKENGGKHTALNAGMRAAPDAELIGCLDADSFVEPDALREIVACFDTPKVMAVTAAMSVHKPETLIERMQYAEYIFGITVRHILSVLNALYVTPGPFSLYHATVFKKLGGFSSGHQTEDMEMALRIQRAHMVIENAPRARVYTKAPNSLSRLIKQRTRWTSGFLRNVLFDYRDLIANPKHGTLGLVVLPIAFLSLAGGMLIFSMSVFLFVQEIIHIVSVTNGIPLSYAFTPHFTFSWFYLPVSSLTLLGAVATLTTITLMFVGKRLSRTPGSIIFNLIAYLLFFSFISPLWAFRSVTDIAVGTHRHWR